MRAPLGSRRDPFDRTLTAQDPARDLPIVPAETELDDYVR